MLNQQDRVLRRTAGGNTDASRITRRSWPRASVAVGCDREAAARASEFWQTKILHPAHYGLREVSEDEASDRPRAASASGDVSASDVASHP